jgi:hypothetical protein
MDGSKIVIAFFNATLDLSFGVAYKSLQNMLQSSPWFRAHGEIRGIKNSVYCPGKNIEFRVGSQEEHGLGQNIFCLTGDTSILTVDGDKRLDDLEGKICVVCQVDSAGNITISNPCSVLRTGSVSLLYKIIFEDGTILRCTGDHRLMKSDGTYCLVKDLKIGDDIKVINNL